MDVRVLKADSQRDMVGERRSMTSNPWLAENPLLAVLGKGLLEEPNAVVTTRRGGKREEREGGGGCELIACDKSRGRERFYE